MQPNSTPTYFLLGLGREGWSSYQYLKQVNPEVKFVITDDQAVDQLSDNWQQELSQNRVSYLSVDDVTKQLANFDQSKQSIVLSPGIPLSHPLCLAIDRLKLQPTSNTELFLQTITNQPIPPLLIGVTGTKGKSTTSSLIHHVLNSASVTGQNSKYTYHLLAGNIGTPPLEILPEIEKLSQSFTQPGTVTLEMSSHQLRLLHTSPNIAVIQNISQEHLDHFGSFEKYVEAKSSIVKFQAKPDLVVFNQDLKSPSQLASLSPAQKLTFVTRDLDEQSIPHNKDGGESEIQKHAQVLKRVQGSFPTTTGSSVQDEGMSDWHDDIEDQDDKYNPNSEPMAWIANNQIICDGQPVIKLDQLPLLGHHNWQNVMPAVVIGHHLGLSHASIAQAIKTFQPLKHRLQKVAEINGVLYVNDTLATGPAAASAALRSFPDRPIIALVGGFDRGLDLTEHIEQLLVSKIKGLILFPTTGDRMEKQLHVVATQTQRTIDFLLHHVTSMSEAIKIAKSLAKPGDVVLLSPGAASFGLFKDYADRGEQFIKNVLNENSNC